MCDGRGGRRRNLQNNSNFFFFENEFVFLLSSNIYTVSSDSCWTVRQVCAFQQVRNDDFSEKPSGTLRTRRAYVRSEELKTKKIINNDNNVIEATAFSKKKRRQDELTICAFTWRRVYLRLVHTLTVWEAYLKQSTFIKNE